MARAPTLVYSIENATATWGTLDLLAETDPDAGVRIITDGPTWHFKRGCDGEFVRIRTSVESATVSVSVSAHGRLNRDLLARWAADSQTGTVVAPFLLADLHAGLVFSAPIAYIEGLPEHGHQRAAAFSLWVLRCPMLVAAPTPGKTTGAPQFVRRFGV